MKEKNKRWAFAVKEVSMNEITCDVLVIGGGLAAAAAAVQAQSEGKRVCITVKGAFGAIGVRGSGASSCGATANGTPRVKAVRPGIEDQQQWFELIRSAGLGLCNPRLARVLVEQEPAVSDLIRSWGIQFCKIGPASLGYPGIAALECILRKSQAIIMEHTMVTDLIMHEGLCTGALCYGVTGILTVISCGAIVIATGGNAQLFRRNVHPDCVTGDGYAMALRAGGTLMNMEFMQIFLATAAPTRNLVHVWSGDALGKIRNAEGLQFLERYMPQEITVQQCLEENYRHAPFSTRDKASRYLPIAIVKEILAGRGTANGAVYYSPNQAETQLEREEYQFLKFKGIDPDRAPIEITMAHQCSNGGIIVDEDSMTDIPGVFAVGESASGMHGADRIGGNMLASCLVFGSLAGKSASRWSERQGIPDAVAAWAKDEIHAVKLIQARKGREKPAEVLRILQDAAWKYALVVRTEEGLSLFAQILSDLEDVLDRDIFTSACNDDCMHALELRNLLLVGKSVALTALKRRESRGGHYREDFPYTDIGTPAANCLSYHDGKLILSSRILDPAWDSENSSIEMGRWG